MIHSSPKIVCVAINFYKHLIQVPPPIRLGHQFLDAFPPNFLREYRPNLFHQNRIVSWLTSIPRSCSRSSTLRRDSGKRTYNITATRANSRFNRLFSVAWSSLVITSADLEYFFTHANSECVLTPIRLDTSATGYPRVVI